MTTAPAYPAPAASPDGLARHLDAIAAALDTRGIACQITSPAGTPVLTTKAPAGPDGATVAIDPDLHARPGPGLDCTCVWTPAPDATPQATAAVIAAVLTASRTSPARARPQPDPAAAARLAMFLRRQPGWSVFWDPRYGLWRAAEDDPGSFLYAENPDPAAIITYITGRS
jgi:hypothetical protein